ncbi:MAG: Rrf2 family transcriptional regulator [Trueperaceae bacterium]|nr:Rrf2 family transcriptional regulator [Trueperaceae bacterium]
MIDASLRTFLGREESYALHALIYAAENPGASAARIAQDLAMPAAFMAKVLGKLAQAGLIENRMGRHGGVHPVPGTRQATLLQVIEAISGPFVMDTCQAQAECITTRRKGYCRLNVAYHQAGAEIRTILMGVRVDDLADAPQGEVPRPAS